MEEERHPRGGREGGGFLFIQRTGRAAGGVQQVLAGRRLPAGAGGACRLLGDDAQIQSLARIAVDLELDQVARVWRFFDRINAQDGDFDALASARGAHIVPPPAPRSTAALRNRRPA